VLLREKWYFFSRRENHKFTQQYGHVPVQEGRAQETSQKRLIPIILPTSEGRLDGSDGWAPFESSHPHAVVFLFALLVAAIAGARSLI
jgi:hypothetical protein